MKRFLKTVIALSTVSIFLCGCADSNDRTNVETSAVVSEEPMPYPFMLNDIEISEKPERVICLSPALAEIMYEMGYSKAIIGRSSYCDYPPEISQITDVGSITNPNLEKISNLTPDLVISSTPISSKDIFALKQAGIKTLIIPAPTTIEGFSSIYKSLGLVFEGRFIGAEKGEHVFSTISSLLGNTDNLNIGNFVYITENYSIAGGDTFESAILSCFGTNIAKNSPGYEYDINNLSENSPDILIINGKYSKEDILNHEILKALDPVKNNKLIFVNNLFFERPTGRLMLLLNNMIGEYMKLKSEN